jgi:hypothetical protein
MKYGKKLVLVDYKTPTVPQPLREMQPQPVTPIINDPIMSTGEYLAMRKIGRDMRTILRHKKLTDGEKVKLYGGLMRRFDIIKDENRRQLNQQRNESLHSLREYMREPYSQTPIVLQQEQPQHQQSQQHNHSSLLTDEDRDESDESDDGDEKDDVTMVQKSDEPMASSTPTYRNRRNKSGRNKSMNDSKKNKSILTIENQRMTRALTSSKGFIHQWDDLLKNDVNRLNKSKRKSS